MIPGLESLSLTTLDPAVDLPQIEHWFRGDYGRFWGLGRYSQAELHQNFRDRAQPAGNELLVGRLAGQADILLLLHLYPVSSSRLATRYRSQPGDWGFHLIVSPDRRPFPGFAYLVVWMTCQHLFTTRSASRVIAEPEPGNLKMIRRLLQAGFIAERTLMLDGTVRTIFLLERHRLSSMNAPLRLGRFAPIRWTGLHWLFQPMRLLHRLYNKLLRLCRERFV